MEGGAGFQVELMCPSPEAPRGASPVALRPLQAVAHAVRAGRTAVRSRAVRVPVPWLSCQSQTTWCQSRV